MHADCAVPIACELNSGVAAVVTSLSFASVDGSAVTLEDTCGSLGFGCFLIRDVFI
jgi:hypothetical protein